MSPEKLLRLAVFLCAVFVLAQLALILGRIAPRQPGFRELLPPAAGAPLQPGPPPP